MVPDEATGKKIAEAIWLQIYGGEIFSDKPFKVKLLDGCIWVVEGTAPPAGYRSGLAYIEIQKSDCKILKVIRGK